MVGTPHKPAVKSFKCGGCGAPLTIRGMGLTTTMACPSCGSIIDIHNPDYKVIHRAQVNSRSTALPLGRRGKIKGTQYEVIGYVQRCDSSGFYHWDEYLLMNPYRGFAWLVCNQGHWSYVQMTKEIPDWDDSAAYFHNTKFKRFLFDSARVFYVMGEFYWRIKVDDTVKTMDFIAPPYMLSSERESSDVLGEIVWSIGEYVTAKEVGDAFGRLDAISFASGVGANQPNPHRKRFYAMLLPWVASLFLAFMITFGSSHRDSEVSSYAGTYYAPSASFDNSFSSSASSNAPIVTRPFAVSGTSNLAVDLDSNVENNWLYMDLTLINSDTKEEFDGSVEVSFYRGVDGGESWSEGGYSSRSYFSSIPGGTYTLTLTPQSQAQAVPSSLPYRIKVTEDVPYRGNFVIVFLALSVVPILILLLSWSFEARRWRSSDQVSE